MPQPVQTPKIPAIVQSVSAQDAASVDQSQTSSKSASIQTLHSTLLATPTPPESFAPDLTIAKSAALLGPPISVESDKKANDTANPTQLQPSSPVESATTQPQLTTYHSAAFSEEATTAQADNSLATVPEPSTTPNT
ncbi:MAG: hypothetical protein WA828_09985, partial [Coleofasciculaceae cyanobacterium]